MQYLHSEQEQPSQSEAPAQTTTTPSEPSFLFGSPSVASLSFQNVAFNLGDSPFGKKTPDKSPGFKGAGSQLFVTAKTADDNRDDNAAEGDHDEPHFEPIIPLPDKIDVKTGEEDDEVMFSHRAKLYRFVAEDKQWKERGIGDIKLLRSAKTGKMRVLMRREQVLKLCANHQITTDMTLQPNAGSDRSWVWSTLADFSEEEHKPERLAVKFKNEGIAKQFKEKFEECQEILKNQSPLEPPVQKEITHEEVKEDVSAKFKAEEGSWECEASVQDETAYGEEVKEDLLAKFKAEEGSWECDSCMVRNSSDKLECVACASSKPGVEVSQDKKMGGKPLFAVGSGATSSGTGFTFGSHVPSSGTGVSFGSGSTPSGIGVSFVSGSAPSGAGFLFGSAATSESGANPFFTFGSSKQVENVTGEQTEEDKKDVSGSDKQTLDEEVDQPGSEEGNGGATTVEAQAGVSKKEETAPAIKR